MTVRYDEDMADAYAALEEGLKLGLNEAVELLDHEPSPLQGLGWDELVEIGRRSVHLALAPILWDQRLGPMLDTAQVCERLGVTRQAVAKAVAAGRLVSLPAGRTRRFPIWQFRTGEQFEIRSEVGEIVSLFRHFFPEVRGLQVASWAMTSQPELDGSTPATWLESGRPFQPLGDAARRTAAALSQ